MAKPQHDSLPERDQDAARQRARELSRPNQDITCPWCSGIIAAHEARAAYGGIRYGQAMPNAGMACPHCSGPVSFTGAIMASCMIGAIIMALGLIIAFSTGMSQLIVLCAAMMATGIGLHFILPHYLHMQGPDHKMDLATADPRMVRYLLETTRRRALGGFCGRPRDADRIQGWCDKQEAALRQRLSTRPALASISDSSSA